YDGHVTDGMYAYLWRGKASSKPESAKLSHINVAPYAVDPTEVTSVELDKDDLNLIVGQSERIVPTILPQNQFTYSNVTWSSSDDSVLTVDKHGVVTGHTKGNATITVTTEDKKHTATRNVIVNDAVLADNIIINSPETINDGTLSATVGDEIVIDAVLSNDATDNRLIYTSSNPEVAVFLGEAVETANPGQIG